MSAVLPIERAFSSSFNGTLVRARCGRRRILRARYCKPEHTWVRTRSVGISDLALERHPARRKAVGTGLGAPRLKVASGRDTVLNMSVMFSRGLSILHGV